LQQAEEKAAKERAYKAKAETEVKVAEYANRDMGWTKAKATLEEKLQDADKQAGRCMLHAALCAVCVL
jgi:hypothetical protein